MTRVCRLLGEVLLSGNITIEFLTYHEAVAFIPTNRGVYFMMYRLLMAAALAASVLLASQTNAADKVEVSFANAAPPSLALGPYAVADLMNYFSEEGLEVTLKTFAGGANTVAQTVNKGADISLPGNEPVIIGKQAGR